MARPAIRATVVVFALFLTGVGTGVLTGSMAAQRAQDPYAPLDTLVRVIGLIQTTWVDEIETDRLVAAAIDGMLDELDPHSVWLSTGAYRDLQRETHGAYTGIGVEVRLLDGSPTVTRVLPGSPAARDGVSVGDVLVTVDGQPLEASDLEGVERALLGPRGERATLEVLRDGWEAPRVLETVRDRVRTPAVTVQRADEAVVYARISQFSEGAALELETALGRADAEGPVDAVILDLRDNPGGLLREAVATVDLFVDDGTIVSTWGRMASEQRTHEATPGARSEALIVLVNGLSASASEIVAGAVQDTGRGQLVGTRTYGKGSVQTVFEHQDGSALKLTIGRYYTPSGEPVAPRDGRAPDVEVPWPGHVPAIERLHASLERDDLPADLAAELRAIAAELPHAELRPTRSDIPWTGTIAERAAADPQLAAALGVAWAAIEE